MAMSCLCSAFVLGLALLSACTVRLELTEHRFAEGDLAAASMGLAAHERWLDRQPREVVQAAVPRRRGRAPESHAERKRGAARTGVRLVTRADDPALAGPDSLARLTASLSGTASVAPALGPSEIHLAANSAAPRPSIGRARSAPRPSPKRPGYLPGPTWVHQPEPKARQEQALRPTAPLPPPARPSMGTSPGRHLGRV